MELLCLLVMILSVIHRSFAKLIAEPVGPFNMVPASPTLTEPQTCRLDLSDELFGGVKLACGKNLDRSRCCPVLAAWLFAAHARNALKVDSPAPAPVRALETPDEVPMMPDDSQKCVNSLQDALLNRSIHIPLPNATCDPILCFCGIRLHKISSLSCPSAFSLNSTIHTAAPTGAVKDLERNCRDPSYTGCTDCLGALQKLKSERRKGTDERASKMFSRDCQVMGLTWLLARNKTAYIPTVSAVLRAIMYSAHRPRESKCSPDQENMPLALDSLELEYAESSSSSTVPLLFTILPLITLGSLFFAF